MSGKPELLTPQEVGRQLKISVRSVHQLVREGKLACFDVGRFSRRFSQSHVDSFLNSKTRQPSDGPPVAIPPPNMVQSPRKGGARKTLGNNGEGLREEMKSWR